MGLPRAGQFVLDLLVFVTQSDHFINYLQCSFPVVPLQSKIFLLLLRTLEEDGFDMLSGLHFFNQEIFQIDDQFGHQILLNSL